MVGRSINVAKNDKQSNKSDNNRSIGEGNSAGIRQSFHDDLLLSECVSWSLKGLNISAWVIHWI